MARWPNVPDVYGWLSLTERGRWRLHPQGDALSPGNISLGEDIANPQILQFINRNYAGDQHGHWFFQNGPQRVFVCLEAAPYILHTTGPLLQLITHNHLPVRHIQAWFVDDAGRLYAQTEHGPGLVDGRDLNAVAESLHTSNNESLMDLLEHNPTPAQISVRHTFGIVSDQPSCLRNETALLTYCTAARIPAAMGFVRTPTANFVTLEGSLK